MPEWGWGVVTPLVVLFVGWLFKRAMTSVVDERVVPLVNAMNTKTTTAIDDIRGEMVSMNGKNTQALNQMHDRISKTNERVARLEGQS